MNNQNPKLLVLVFGGTTTKLALYKGDDALYKETLRHSLEEMNQYKTVWDQNAVRRRDIIAWVESKGQKIEELDTIVSYSGIVKPCEPGVYEVDEAMVADMRGEKYAIHASNAGCVLCYELGKEFNRPVITSDPTTDIDMMKIARYSGLPQIERMDSYHVPNHKATAHSVAAKLGKKYEECNIIVAHIGSGTTVGAHCHGQVIDVNNGVESDGPFSAVRCGAVPVGPLVDMCYSGKYTKQEMHKLLGAQSGLAGYLNTSDGLEIDKRIESGDEEAKAVVEAMSYQTAKEIGACAVTLHGKVDAIAITGGLANWKFVVDCITSWVDHIAPVFIYPGENELESLAAGALRYMRGEEDLKKY